MMEFVKYASEHFAEIMLGVGTFGLWWSTARMNHFEKLKQIDALSKDNDNMTRIASEAIYHGDKHMEAVRQMKQIRRNHR